MSDITQFSIAELEAEIKRRKSDWSPRPVESYTDEEIWEAFSRIHLICTSNLKDAIADQQWDGACDSDVAEHVCKFLFGATIWDELEKLGVDV